MTLQQNVVYRTISQALIKDDFCGVDSARFVRNDNETPILWFRYSHVSPLTTSATARVGVMATVGVTFWVLPHVDTVQYSDELRSD